MRALMIAAPASGNGKTTVTMGLLRALRRRGLDVCGYKVGPDYLDPAFLAVASGQTARNLDVHLQGSNGVWESLVRGQNAYAVIEGVMGYFDGIGNTYRNSSYELARMLGIPTILVYTPAAEMFTIIPKLKGLAEFEVSTIQAVIFNNVTPAYYALIKEAVEQYTPLRVLGGLPKTTEVALQNRHLGLVQSMEIPDLEAKIERLADLMTEQIDLDQVLALMTACQMPPLEQPMEAVYKPQRALTIAVANDQAFAFYYPENLELLAAAGRIVYFSPLCDAGLPECDLVYLGGGYPEIFRTELSANRLMRESIKAYAERGGYLYAECGGLMYLTESIEDVEMVGIFRGKTTVTSRLQRFGYVDITLQTRCLLGEPGERLTGHEFHHAVSAIEGAPVYGVSKTGGTQTWTCGYAYKNVLAAYPHLSFLGNRHALNTLLRRVDRREEV